MKRTLLALTALLSINANAGMDEVNESRLANVTEQIKEIANGIEPVAIYDGGQLKQDSLSLMPGGNYEVTLRTSGDFLASFLIKDHIATTEYNQVYVVTSAGGNNWLCVTQNEPFNHCYKITSETNTKGWAATTARAMFGAKQNKN